MVNKHIIENAVFDISFASEEEASEQQSALDEFVNRRLLPLVERVFDELSLSGVVCRIEELELDLGQVPFNGYQDELEVRLEATLRAELLSSMPPLTSLPGASGSGQAGYGMSQEGADLQQVEYFLRHGNLPWNSTLDAGLTFDDLAWSVVRTKGPELVEFLRRSAGDRTVARRVVSQFSGDLLAEIAALLAPSLSGSMSEIFDRLAQVWRESNQGASPSSAVRRLIWERIIGELLGVGLAALTKEDLVSQVEQKIIGPEAVPASPSPGTGAPVDGTVEDSPTGGQSETPAQALSLEIESMRRRLAAGLLSGDARALERIWPTLLREHPGLLAEAARHYLRSARIRKNIVGALPESMLADILRALGTETTDTVSEVVRESTALAKSLLSASDQAPPSEEAIAGLVWEHAIAYMLAQDESAGFDLTTYTESLIQRTTEQYGITNHDRLLDRLAAGLESSTGAGVTPSPFLAVVRELARSAEDTQTASGDSQGPAMEVLQSYDLYEELKERLHGAESPQPTVPLTELIGELTRLYSWQMHNLLREFQSGAVSAGLTADSLPAEDLGYLIQAMLSVVERVEEAGSSGLMRAVEAYSGQAPDLRRYYQRVLEALVVGQPLDFEAIIEAERAQDDPALADPVLDRASSLADDLRRELRAGTTTPAEVFAGLDVPKMAHLVEAMLTDQADLYPSIEAYGREAADPHLFYRQILDRLLEDQRVDLDQIAASVRPVEGPAEPGSADRSQDLVDAFDLYQQLRERLTQPLEVASPDGESTTSLFDELAKAHPELLQRLLREFQSGGITAAQASARLDVEGMQSLVRAFLAVGRQPGDGEPSELLDSMSDFAQRAADPAWFYQQVLEHVLTGRIIDLEQIAAEPGSEDRSQDLVDAFDLYQRLRERLTQPEEAATPDGESTASLIDELLRTHPEQLQRLFREFRSGQITAGQAAARLDSEGMQSLIRVFLAIGRQPGDGEASELLDSISDFAQRAADPAWFYQQVLEHVLADRVIDLEEIAAGPGSEQPSQDLVDAFDLYQQLRERLTQPLEVASPDGESTANLIDELARSHPEQLRRLFREFRSGQITAGQAATRLDPEGMHSLVRAFLAVGRQSGGEEPSELLDSISDFAQRAADPGWFYQQVLEHVLADRFIDLEEIASGPGREQPSQDLVHPFDLYRQLRERLTEREETFAPDSKSTANLIDELARIHPDQLQRLFREFQSGKIDHADASALLSADELAHLTQAFLAVNRRPGDDGHQVLSESIRTFAQRAEDAHRFYSELLARLVQDRLMDLEAMAAGDAELPAAIQVPQTEAPSLGTGSMSEGDAIQALSEYLRGGEPRAGDEAARLVRSIEVSLAAQSRPLRQLLVREMDSRDAASRLIDLLPDRLLTRVLHLMRPSEHYQTQRTADILADGLYARELGLPADRVRHLKWRYIFQYVFERGIPFRQTVFVRDFIEFIAGQPGLPGVEELRGILAQQLTANVLPSSRQLQLQIMWAVTRGAHETRDSEVGEAAPAATEAPDRSAGRHGEERPHGDIYIANAGLVLAAPYLQRLFEMLDLTDGPAFRSDEAAQRAVHLLQFMADESGSPPEHLLVLNKILCGVRTNVPIVRDIDLTAHEKEAVEGLVQGMVQNWTALGNTSVAGFRESFLQREGRLNFKDNAWRLLVLPKAFDMLLDQIPWSYSTIRLPWMERVIYVEWR